MTLTEVAAAAVGSSVSLASGLEAWEPASSEASSWAEAEIDRCSGDANSYRHEPHRLRSFFAAAGRRSARGISPVKLTAVDTVRSGARKPLGRFVVTKKPSSRLIG